MALPWSLAGRFSCVISITWHHNLCKFILLLNLQLVELKCPKQGRFSLNNCSCHQRNMFVFSVLTPMGKSWSQSQLMLMKKYWWAASRGNFWCEELNWPLPVCFRSRQWLWQSCSWPSWVPLAGFWLTWRTTRSREEENDEDTPSIHIFRRYDFPNVINVFTIWKHGCSLCLQ